MSKYEKQLERQNEQLRKQLEKSECKCDILKTKLNNTTKNTRIYTFSVDCIYGVVGEGVITKKSKKQDIESVVNLMTSLILARASCKDVIKLRITNYFNKKIKTFARNLLEKFKSKLELCGTGAIFRYKGVSFDCHIDAHLLSNVPWVEGNIDE